MANHPHSLAHQQATTTLTLRRVERGPEFTLPTLRVVAGPDMLKFSSVYPGERILIGRDEAADLTLTEADINALSGNADTLTVHGEADDTLTITGASAAGTETIDGETYNVYTIGDDGTTLIVDEDINTVI